MENGVRIDKLIFMWGTQLNLFENRVKNGVKFKMGWEMKETIPPLHIPDSGLGVRYLCSGLWVGTTI